MGLYYTLVHVKYNLPPALALSAAFYPLCTRLGIYKIAFLITIAVISATPWDSYLVRNRIWTYPPDAVLGPTIFSIPIEEVFFFVIQTYNTSLLYLITSTPAFHPAYLRGKKLLHDSKRMRLWRWIGIVIIAFGILSGLRMVRDGGQTLYMGMILIWAGPFILLLWSLAYQFIIGLPLWETLMPIAVPTLYLWAVDTLSLKRGVWAISPGTKLGWYLFRYLDIEEAVFFLATNTLVVFGLIAFDNAVAILDAFPALFPQMPPTPSPMLLVQALLTPSERYDELRIYGLKEASDRLKSKSRSFHLASGFFKGRLRVDLLLLYSFCRMADDLIDNAKSVDESRHWAEKLKKYLDWAYNEKSPAAVEDYIRSNFPISARASLRLLPTSYLSSQPLYDLLKGFETDSQFAATEGRFPITDLPALILYGSQVAGTVAELCLELVYHHTGLDAPSSQREKIMDAGRQMGVALQMVNIARDIVVDAENGRVYIPTDWLQDLDLTPEKLIREPEANQVHTARLRLVELATARYEQSSPYIEQLPSEARGPMRVAVQSYMEIGWIIKSPRYKFIKGRATVPKTRRIAVALRAMLGR